MVRGKTLERVRRSRTPHGREGAHTFRVGRSGNPEEVKGRTTVAPANSENGAVRSSLVGSAFRRRRRSGGSMALVSLAPARQSSARRETATPLRIAFLSYRSD